MEPGAIPRLAAIVGVSVSLLGESDDSFEQSLLGSSNQLAFLSSLTALLTEFANQVCNHLNGFVYPLALIRYPLALIRQLLLGL